MKNLVTILPLVCGLCDAPAQVVFHNPGIVSFVNTESATSGLPAGVTNHLVGICGIPIVGTQYKAELYYLDTDTSSLAPLPASISPFKASTTTMPGTWNGPTAPISLPSGYGGIDLFDDGSGTLAEAGDGSGNGPGYYPVSLSVRVWDSTTGLDWETALIRLQSTDFTYTQRFTFRTTDTQMIRQPGFTTLACPEPSAVALAVLGVSFLLFFHRRTN